jgi:hypothetical protein
MHAAMPEDRYPGGRRLDNGNLRPPLTACGEFQARRYVARPGSTYQVNCQACLRARKTFLIFDTSSTMAGSSEEA